MVGRGDAARGPRSDLLDSPKCQRSRADPRAIRSGCRFFGFGFFFFFGDHLSSLWPPRVASLLPLERVTGVVSEGKVIL